MTQATVPELVGTAEIGEILGVTRQRVWQLAMAEGFPEPVQAISAGVIWRKADIEAWHKGRVSLRKGTDR